MDTGLTSKAVDDPKKQTANTKQTSDSGDWEDVSDKWHASQTTGGSDDWVPVDVSGKPLSLQGYSGGGFPVYQGTPVAKPWYAPANEKENPSAYDPNTLRGYGARWGEAFKGGVASLHGLVDPNSLPGTDTNPVIWNPVTQLKKDWQGVKDWNELRKVNSDYAWGAVLAPMLLTHTLSGMLEPAGMTAKLTRGAGVDPKYIEPIIGDLQKYGKGAVPRSVTNPLGKPMTVGDFIAVAGKAEKALNDEYAQALGNHAIRQGNLPDINGKFPLAEAIRKLKDRIPNVTSADRAERMYVEHLAAEYEKPITLGELDLKRMQANNRLTAYYDKNDVAQYSTTSKNAEIAIDKTVADWVRGNVYPEMDRLTGKPRGYFGNIKTRIGNLMNAQSQAKEFAEKVHAQTMEERGKTAFERVRPGASISGKGTPHGFISNLPAVIRPPDPEAAANAAVRRAFSLRENLPSLRKAEALSLPLSGLVGYLRAYQSSGAAPTQAAPQSVAAPPRETLPALQTQAEAQKPAPQPTKKSYAHWANLHGRTIGSDDGKTWFDYDTGRQVQ